MSTPPPQPQQHPPLETEPSQSASSNRCLRSCERTLSWRGWLVYLALLMVIAIIIGIVCTAHVYYHNMGGQGWLKIKYRTLEEPRPGIYQQQVYLPSRRLAVYEPNRLGSQMSVRAPANVPYYTCGDQQSSCEAYGHAVS